MAPGTYIWSLSTVVKLDKCCDWSWWGVYVHLPQGKW